jgi:diguanylate cyclase (GGDEF)-like protein
MGGASRQLKILTGVEEPRRGQKQTVEVPARHGFAQRAAAILERQPAWLVFIVGLAWIALVTIASYLSGGGLSLTPLYLVPVALVSWASARVMGVTTAIVATLTWSVAYVGGELSAQLANLTTYWNIAAQLTIFLVVSLVLSGLRGALGHEKALARTDPVTGAANSRAFFEQLDKEFVRSIRYDHTFTVAYLDADNFKSINDNYGHMGGDALLRAVVDTVQANIRSTDLLARIAGDEFTLLLPETGREESELVMARVRKGLAAAMQAKGWSMTFSIGVVTYATPPASVDSLLQIADDLMYSVKRGGKDSVRYAVYGEREGAA